MWHCGDIAVAEEEKMKYCAHCGSELLDEAVICPKCGCRVENVSNAKVNDQKDLVMVIKIVMIICCVIGGFAIIPLAWMIPMTVSVTHRLENREPIGIGFKICVLLFVSVIAGIMLFFVDTENYRY